MSPTATARQADPDRGERLATPVFAQLLLTQALFGLGWSMFLVIPKFLVQRFDADPVQVGWITAVPGLAVVLSIPLVAKHIGHSRLQAELISSNPMHVCCSCSLHSPQS